MATIDMGEELPHIPVLYHEIIHALQPRRGGRYVDGTLGAGGHAWGLLQTSLPDGMLLGLDLDPQALKIACQRLAPFGERAVIRQASFADMQQILMGLGWLPVDGILLDIGVSSMQLDTPERGFSFQNDAPLDMRFDPRNLVCAAELVNQLPENDLADLLYRYGEERRARQIAHAIIRARPLQTTRQLADLIAQLPGYSRQEHLHPATRSFQALRIAVNQELQVLETALPQAIACLAQGGRLAVISFHSLEDRLVKHYFRQESRDCLCPARQPVCTCGHRASVFEVTHRPIRPGAAEEISNPRACSARLRVVEKL